MGFSALEKIRAKTDRADEHIKELDAAVRVFLDSCPYEVRLNPNHQTGRIEWTLTSGRVIPIQIAAIAGDAIQNLRSALDHIVWALVLANNAKPKDGVTGFPISETAKQYTSSSFRRKIEGIGPEALRAIDALRPYKNGNPTLWQLNSLNVRDKRRLLLSAASALTYHHVLPSQREELIRDFFGSYPDATEAPDLIGTFIKPTAARFPLEVGKVFFSIPISEMEKDFTFKLGIAFNEPGIVEGEPVLETVKRFSDHVNQIIADFTLSL
jgi:hypothetical protein